MKRIKILHNNIIQDSFEGLKSCPFCGNSNIYISKCGNFVIQPETREYERLVCWDCGIGTTSWPKNEMDKCIDNWNTRDEAT